MAHRVRTPAFQIPNPINPSEGGTMKSDQQQALSLTPSGRWTAGRLRLAGGAAAVAAVLILWSVIRYGTGIRLHAPAFSATQRPMPISAGSALIAAAVAALAGWGLARLLEAKALRPRRAWLVTALIVLAASLSAPLSGHGGNRLALVCMHLAVGAVLIPVYARSLRP
jgi:hypothetical protein